MKDFRPATRKQTYAIYCLLKKDVRNENLSLEQASEMIKKALAEKNGTKAIKEPKLSLRSEFISYFKKNMNKVIEVTEKELGIKSIVSNDNLYMKEKKNYAMFGGALGIVWFKYRKNNKIAKEINDLFLELCSSYDATCFLNIFLSYFDKGTINYFHKVGCPLEALFHQNLKIQLQLHHMAIEFAASKGVKMDMDYNDD